jgi:hypothetical protein
VRADEAIERAMRRRDFVARLVRSSALLSAPQVV